MVSLKSFTSPLRMAAIIGSYCRSWCVSMRVGEGRCPSSSWTCTAWKGDVFTSVANISCKGVQGQGWACLPQMQLHCRYGSVKHMGKSSFRWRTGTRYFSTSALFCCAAVWQ